MRNSFDCCNTRPSVDVITGTIKANFPSRISFRVSSKIDSRTILGEQGAEQLLGQGDMLYSSTGGKLIRMHGPFISDAEVNKVVSFVKKQGLPEYIDEIEQMMNKTKINNKGKAEMDFDTISQNDDIYNQAINVVLSTGKASTSLQRSLQIGYNKAATLIEKMESESIISAPNHVGKRRFYKTKNDKKNIICIHYNRLY